MEQGLATRGWRRFALVVVVAVALSWAGATHAATAPLHAEGDPSALCGVALCVGAAGLLAFGLARSVARPPRPLFALRRASLPALAPPAAPSGLPPLVEAAPAPLRL
jgi:hypothetical protein